MTTVVYRDIPNERVAQLTAAARFDGATSIEVVDKGNGKSDITVVYPSAAADAGEAAAKPPGEGAAPT